MWIMIFVLAPCFAVHVINSNNDIMNTTNTQLNDTAAAPTVVTSSQPAETRATFQPTESAMSNIKETFNMTGTSTTIVSATSVYHSTVKVYASTKSVEKNARKQHLNTSSSALSGAGVVGGSGAHSGRLQERLAAIECDLPLLPRVSRLWRGNETHELKLPVTMVEECGGGAASSGEECPPVVVSWEGAADIQSGDILIVRIADSSLLDIFGPTAAGRPNGTHDTNSLQVDGERVHHTLPQPAVYQVTRQGHEHCDVSDGMLLDITPLDDQGDKLITLYDKDLTEGVNFLIVVSESWRSQCVRLKVTVKSDNCGDSQDCSGKGVCYTNVSMDGYECQCCHGYVGPHCEERDACHPTPCMNNGICVKTTQLNDASYRCLCPYGFTGRKCEKDPCASSPCLNGGSCMSMVINNSTSYRCACADGWMGSRCQLPISGNVCVSNPCVNGICVEHDDDTDGRKYRCFCQPGYTGEQCDLEYNECESSPCANGGTCTDRIGRFECACGRGYTGNTCQLKVDLCSPDPCPSSRYCVDRGNSYSCECPHGYIGEECRMPTTSPCDNNPCAHGGTCWSGVDTFYCSCRAEYTGRLCEETFVLESVVGSEAAIETHVQGEEGGGGGSVREVRLPLGLYHDRLHNVYIAAGTLGAAIAIVGVVVTACHCRVNKTYARMMSRLSRVATPGAPHHWLHDKRAPPPSLAPFTPSHALDTTDMYYTLDFSDSQSSPLIQ